MMEQRRDERNGFDGFLSRMRGGKRPAGDERMEGFEHERCDTDRRSCEMCGGRDGFHGHHDRHDMRELFMKRLGGLPGARRGIFDPHDFLRDAFSMEVREEAEAYCLQAQLPGIKKEAIRLESLPGMLLITVEDEKKNTTERPLYLAHCDEENIRANCRDGVLEILIPKSKGRKIEIE